MKKEIITVGGVERAILNIDHFGKYCGAYVFDDFSILDNADQTVEGSLGWVLSKVVYGEVRACGTFPISTGLTVPFEVTLDIARSVITPKLPFIDCVKLSSGSVLCNGAIDARRTNLYDGNMVSLNRIGVHSGYRGCHVRNMAFLGFGRGNDGEQGNGISFCLVDNQPSFHYNTIENCYFESLKKAITVSREGTYYINGNIIKDCHYWKCKQFLELKGTSGNIVRDQVMQVTNVTQLACVNLVDSNRNDISGLHFFDIQKSPINPLICIHVGGTSTGNLIKLDSSINEKNILVNASEANIVQYVKSAKLVEVQI